MQGARRVILAWSSGKDGAWSLHVLRRDPGVEVVGLLTVLDADRDRVPMHATPASLLRRQAESARLPLRTVPIPTDCTADEYASIMGRTLRRFEAEGVTHIAFGDLFLEDVRAAREAKMRDVGIELLFPLWGRDTRALAREMVDAGLRAIVTSVQPCRLPKDFLGRTYDRSFLADLPQGVDPCGEHGELHTFVVEGPMLHERIEVVPGGVSEDRGHLHLALDEARAVRDSERREP